MYSVGAVKVGGDYKVGVYRDERESFWRVVNKCIEEHGHVITRHKCLDGKTRSVAINDLEGFVEYVYNTELPLLWPVSGRRTWKKHAVPQEGVVYFRAKNYQQDEDKFFNEYLWWLMAYYAKGEPLDTKGATELAERLAEPLGHYDGSYGNHSFQRGPAPAGAGHLRQSCYVC